MLISSPLSLKNPDFHKNRTMWFFMSSSIYLSLLEFISGVFWVMDSTMIFVSKQRTTRVSVAYTLFFSFLVSVFGKFYLFRKRKHFMVLFPVKLLFFQDLLSRPWWCLFLLIGLKILWKLWSHWELCTVYDWFFPRRQRLMFPKSPQLIKNPILFSQILHNCWWIQLVSILLVSNFQYCICRNQWYSGCNWYNPNSRKFEHFTFGFDSLGNNDMLHWKSHRLYWRQSMAWWRNILITFEVQTLHS